MADKKQPGDGTPSADEIIEALALEMGVDSPSAEDAAVEEPAEEEAPTEEAAAEPEAKAEPEPKPKKKKKGGDKKAGKKASGGKKGGGDKPVKSAGIDAIDSLFDVGGTKADVDLDDIHVPGAGVNDDEFDALERKVGGGGSRMMTGIIVVLVLAFVGMAAIAFGGDDLIGDIGAVFNGTYRDKKDAQKRRIEEDHRKKQLEAMERYGALNPLGTPAHALIQLQLEGWQEPRTIYAQYAEGSPWTEMRLSPTTIIQGLKVKNPISVRVQAPGYRPMSLTLTENMWTRMPTGDYMYTLNSYLEPESGKVAELADRMNEFEEDDEVGGTIKVVSKPAGAKIKLDNKLVVDKDGNPILTPATLTHLVLDPEAKSKEKKLIKINVPHHKIDVFFDSESEPRYETGIYRNLWVCAAKEDKVLKRLPKDARPYQKCVYSYDVNADFDAIKVEMRRQEVIKQEMQKQKEKLEQLEKEMEEAKRKL